VRHAHGMIPPRVQIDELASALRDAGRELPAKDVRRMRIAALRLSVWLDLGGRRVLRDDLRWLRRTLAPLRDLDVLLELAAGAPWGADLASRRESARFEVARALEDRRVAGLETALANLPALPENKARAGLARLVRHLLRAAEELHEDGESLEGLHRLRRKLRSLRYAYEWLGEAPSELVVLQRSLGLLNNLALCARHLAEIAERQDVRSERAAIDAAISEQRAQALGLWSAIEARIGVAR
jgi:CHAD domain-containing protein